MNSKKVLKASSYYLEDVLGYKLDERAEQGKISFLLLNQPPKCDAHCRRCFMPEYRRNSGIKEALILDESKRVLDKARDYGALCLEISGEGEPAFHRDNLLKIIEHANNLGYLTTLITNGHHLSNYGNHPYYYIKDLKDMNVTLVFSHFSLNLLKYEDDSHTVTGTFVSKMRNIETAMEKVYWDTIEHVNGFQVQRLAIHATLQRDNVQDVLDLKKYCDGERIFFSVAPLAQTGCALDHPEMKLEDIVDIQGQKIPLSEVPNTLSDNSIIHSHSSARELGREVCGTCFYGLNIGYDGAVLFDAHAGYEIGNMLGNVRDTDFSKIIKKQRKISKTLFENIDGFCPVRDPKWNEFLRKILEGEIRI